MIKFYLKGLLLINLLTICQFLSAQTQLSGEVGKYFFLANSRRPVVSDKYSLEFGIAFKTKNERIKPTLRLGLNNRVIESGSAFPSLYINHVYDIKYINFGAGGQYNVIRQDNRFKWLLEGGGILRFCGWYSVFNTDPSGQLHSGYYWPNVKLYCPATIQTYFNTSFLYNMGSERRFYVGAEFEIFMTMPIEFVSYHPNDQVVGCCGFPAKISITALWDLKPIRQRQGVTE